MTFRKWLAWRLVRLAHRLHDAEWVEELRIKPPTGHPIHIAVVGDEYGCGISGTNGIPWRVVGTLDGNSEAAEVDGWYFEWPNPVRRND